MARQPTLRSRARGGDTTAVAEKIVGLASEFSDETRKVIEVNGMEIAIFRWNGQYYAFENFCLHMGGPVGEGVILGKVEAVLDENKCYLGERFSETEFHLVCPWHGYEYDIETGRFAGDRRRKLRKFEVQQRQEKVYVRVD